MALAGRVIASHYAQPLDRRLSSAAELKAGPSAESETIARLAAGESYALLDDSLGWAWGYAGDDRRVGYVPSTALA